MSLPLNLFWGFVVCDLETTFPLYSQYNFDFFRYATDFGIISNSKYNIFADFWIRNENNFNLVYTVKQELQKYFTPMTLQIINFINNKAFAAHTGRLANDIPTGALTLDLLFNQQFDVINYTDIELPLVEDFHYENSNGIYTKYNFLFDKFSNDFQIYGTKRLIFTFFVLRNKATSGNLYDGASYGINVNFEKYFDQTNKNLLIDYLINYGIGSASKSVPNSYLNIDFNEYIKNNQNLSFVSIEDAKNEWLSYGQFERRIITFLNKPLTNLEQLKNSVCIINAPGEEGTGFVVNGKDNNIYVMTAYHIFSQDFNIRLFLATFEYNNNNLIQIITAQFRIIGKDSFYDMAVGKFDSSLPFNIQNNVTDLNFIPKLNIDVDNEILKNDDIFLYGRIGMAATSIFVQGKVLQEDYTGTIDSDINTGKYVLSASVIAKGMSGGPQFVYKNGNYYLKAMTSFTIDGLENITCGIISNIMNDFFRISIKSWNYYSQLYNFDYAKLDRLIELGYLKAWLGASGTYYDKSEFYNFTQLDNFEYTGGYIITNIIHGFNFSTGEFIFNTFELDNLQVISLSSPLQNTLIQKRLIESNAPIVIKKLAYYDSIENKYIEYNIGKYSGQDSLYKFQIGFQAIGSVITNDSTYNGNLKFELPILRITYSYYNGQTWVDDIEYVGGNDPSWYVQYKNISGEIKTVHRFVIPPFLLLYTSNLTKNKILTGYPSNEVGVGYPGYPAAEVQVGVTGYPARTQTTKTGYPAFQQAIKTGYPALTQPTKAVRKG